METEYFGEPKPLGEWLKELGSWPSEGVLYVETNHSPFSASTSCYPTVFDPDDFSQEDFDRFEDWLYVSKFSALLSEDDVKGVISNLEQQQENYHSELLFQAITYYWKHDAFIQL